MLGTRISTNAVAETVARPFGDAGAPDDLRRTFTGDLLDSDADLSVASNVLGHVSPATTVGYGRRGHAARRSAVETLDVPFEPSVRGDCAGAMFVPPRCIASMTPVDLSEALMPGRRHWFDRPD